MPDCCLFFDDLLRQQVLRQRSYEIRPTANGDLSCVEASARRGQDWLFARRWVRTTSGQRELYRLLDHLESIGFHFRISTLIPPARLASEDPEDFSVRASALLSGLSPEERRLHVELFPEEASLLRAGYDWDNASVYRDGVALAADSHGRVMEAAGGILYEWVRIPAEVTWRRYPLERIRVFPTQAATTGGDAVPTNA